MSFIHLYLYGIISFTYSGIISFTCHLPSARDSLWSIPAITLRLNQPVGQGPLAEIAPGHWIRSKRDPGISGLSSRLALMLIDRYRRESTSTPVASLDERRLIGSPDQKAGGRGG